jgi:membrane-bound lytic murein transglycosylase MltF
MRKVSKIKIIEINSGECLFECDIDQSELAYQRATHYDGLGLDVKVVIPSTTKTLFDALGNEEAQWDNVEEELNAEIESHDDSCCSEVKKSNNPTYQ